MKPFTLLSKKRLLWEPFCKVEEHRVVLPDGEETDWWIKISPDAVKVIPITVDGRILLQRNYKYGCREVVTEFCAGVIDPGESPIVAAKRELLEETGYAAEDYTLLGTSFGNPTSSKMQYHCVLAKNITLQADQELESAEQIETFFVQNLAEAKKLLLDPHTLTSSSTVAALQYLEYHLANR